MTVTESVRRAGGIVRLRTLRHHGWSERAVRRAVDARELVRPRKGWVALPGADPLLLSATRAGVVISCVTRAQRMGLWVLDAPDRPHVAAPPCSSTVHIGTDAATGEPKAVVHWAQPIVPRHPDAVEDTIENTLALVAGCVPFEEALAVWESALDKRLVTLPELRRLPFRGRAQEILTHASPYSGSGLESFVLPRLAWLHVPISPQVWLAGHRVDFLIGDRLVLQIDGSTHVGAQRDSDIRHDAQLMLLGYHVIRVGYDQVVNRWHEVQSLVQRAVAQGLHLVR